MHITFRQLHVFRAVATLGQVQLAARQLHLSQPATSMALAELEKNLGNQLFDRTGNRLLLNSQGTKLLPMVCELLDRSDEILRQFAHDDEHTGKLTIGTSTTIGNYLLPEELVDFGNNNSGVVIDLEIHNTTTIIDRLVALEIDLACVEGPCQHQDIEAIPWREDELVVFCSPKHPLAKEQQVTMSQLAEAEWILREEGSGTRMLFELQIGQYLRIRHLKMELNQTEAIKNMVSCGFGISWLSELCISKELAKGELIRLPLAENTNKKRTLWILLNKHKYRGAVVNNLLDKLLVVGQMCGEAEK